MKSMKTWKKPVVKVMSTEELNVYIRAAAKSENLCFFAYCR